MVWKGEEEEAAMSGLARHSSANANGWSAFFFFPSKHPREFLGMDLRRNDQEGVQGVQLHLGHGVKIPLPSKLKW